MRTVKREPFLQRPWPEIAAWYRELIAAGLQIQYLLDIVESIIASPVSGDLAGTTSMHDLVVTNLPIDEPVESVVVRAPGSLRPTKSGGVRIDHTSASGRDEVIERPESEAVRLFWRFIIEKFGIDPAANHPRPTAATRPSESPFGAGSDGKSANTAVHSTRRVPPSTTCE